MDFKKTTSVMIICYSITTPTIAQSFTCSSDEELTPIGITLGGEKISECAKISSQSDIFESSYGMTRLERKVFDTKDYNCHGLAYNNRSNWLDYPNHLLYQALIKGWYYTSLTSAQKGDRGSLFVNDEEKGIFNINGKKYYISHSWIFDENYIDSSSKVRSKYGSLGEYVHSYAKMLPVYKETNNDFVLILPYSQVTSMQKTIENLIVNSNHSQDKFKQEFIIDTEELSNYFNKTSELFDKQLNQNFNLSSNEIIKSLKINDFVGFLTASSELNKYSAIKKSAKLNELYNRHQNGEDIKILLLKHEVSPKLKSLILDFLSLLK